MPLWLLIKVGPGHIHFSLDNTSGAGGWQLILEMTMLSHLYYLLTHPGTRPMWCHNPCCPSTGITCLTTSGENQATPQTEKQARHTPRSSSVTLCSSAFRVLSVFCR